MYPALIGRDIDSSPPPSPPSLPVCCVQFISLFLSICSASRCVWLFFTPHHSIASFLAPLLLPTSVCSDRLKVIFDDLPWNGLQLGCCHSLPPRPCYQLFHQCAAQMKQLNHTSTHKRNGLAQTLSHISTRQADTHGGNHSYTRWHTPDLQLLHMSQ